MASFFLPFDFSGLLCFVYEPRCPMEKLPNPRGLPPWELAIVYVVKGRGGGFECPRREHLPSLRAIVILILILFTLGKYFCSDAPYVGIKVF